MPQTNHTFRIEIDMTTDFKGFTATVSRDALLADLAVVARAAEEKTTIPVLACVLLEVLDGRLRLECTDLDVRISMAHEHALLETSGSGALAVPAGPLAKVLAAMGETIELRQTHPKLLTIASGPATVTMPAWEKSDMPTPHKIDPTATVTVPAKSLAEAAAGVLHCISSEDSRFQINVAQISWGGGRMWCVATDGHRMAVQSREVEVAAETPEILIPRLAVQALAELGASGNAEIRISKTHAEITIDGVAITARMMEGKFPQWRKVKPEKWTTEATIPATEIIAACNLFKALGRLRMRLEFADGKLRVQGATDDGATVSQEVAMPGEITGEPVTLGISPRYFRKAAKTTPGDLVEMRLSTANTQIIFCAPGDLETNWQIIMPMKLDGAA